MNQMLSDFIRRWLAVLSLVFGVALGAYAESVEIDGLYYELNTSARTATLTYQNTTTSNYASLPASVTVPETVSYNGVSFSVTTIADKAFANCKALESISIPATVTTLGTTKWNQNTPYGGTLPFY
ncbi:MAG: leucine-rich repeat domain-containing protein, partial [Muribaculaceae bacterium]|nr:leucine-rich repeat domain-containing protein [Muribaculaceae bacterium]